MEAAVASDPTLEFNGRVVRLVKGDITELEIDAFVFYAQPDLALGSGFGGMITVRGGPAIQKEMDALVDADGELKTGDAVFSDAGRLKADWIIHAVGPRFRENDIEPKLQATMVSCFARAEEKGLTTLAFPAMGSGYYGIPAPVSARVMLEAIKEHLGGQGGLKEIVICVLDSPQFKAFEAAMAALN